MSNSWIASSRFVSLMLFVGLTVLISGNALFLQTSPHPAPLFFTRNVNADADTAKPVPAPVTRGDMVARVVSRPKERPAADRNAAAGVPRGDPVTLVIQQALADAAYGPLSADGIAGQKTADAIRRFQLDQGMAVTGKIDDELITRLVSVGAMAQR